VKTYGKIIHDEADGVWRIFGEPHILLRAKRVFEKISKSQHGELTLTDSLENSRDLEWFIQRYPMQVDAADLSLMKRKSAGHLDHIQRLEDLIDPGYVPRAVNLAIPPRDYQRRASEVHLMQKFLLLGDDVGLGKTCVAICSMADKQTLPAVVVAYPHLQRQWAEEIKKFAPGLFVHICKVGKPYELPRWQCPRCAEKYKPRRRKEVGQLLMDPVVCKEEGCGRGPDVVIVTYTKLSGWAQVLAGYAKSIYFDEVQELRHPGTDKYLGAEHVARKCEFTMGMSATPIFNYGAEIFNIIEVIAPGKLGTSVEFFREWAPYGTKGSVHDPKAFGSYLRENLLMLRRTRTEVGRELPPVIRIPYQIDCDTSELQKIEGSASELARIILGNGEAFKGQRMQAAEELSNIVRQATGIAKAPYVADFVRILVESGEKVVLAGWHRAVYEIWAERLKDLRIGWYTGSESPVQKDAAAKLAVEGELDVVFISLRSGSGLNGLQEKFKTVVIGELDWAPAVHEQLIGRVARDGQTESVSVYFLLSDGGADPVMADVLGIKRNQLEGIRSPTADPIEAMQTDPSKVRKLAEQYIKKVTAAAREEAYA
jgi:SNF2 family DNA or RNA helicase